MAASGDRRIGMDEEQVAITSRRLTTSAEDVGILHATTKAALDDSGAGHVGASARAISELSSHWAATGRRHTDRIDTFGRTVGDAGVRMTATNEDNARLLRDVPNGQVL